MNYPMITLTRYGRFRSEVHRILKRPYLAIAILGYVLVALMILVYLSKAPSYTSDMELVLPGTGSSSSVSLDDVGQVVTQTNTPFSGGGFNPRVNYKEMLASRSVRERAATSLNISVEYFGAAKIKLTEQTSIISLSINASSKDLAQAKALALYNALQKELDILRADEVLRHDESIKQVLNQYREKMNSTRNAIVDFQQRSMIVSTNQMQQLIQTLSGVKERQLYLKAEIEQSREYINQLSQELGVSPKLAAQALTLQSDIEFRTFIAELETSLSLLTEYSSRWGAKHPKVITQQKRVDYTRKAINDRSMQLFGINTTDIFDNLNLDFTPKKTQLFADLIDGHAEQKGKSSMLAELERSANHISDQLKVYSREIVELERLESEFNMAEAVFTSAAARLEANKSDIFASYPVIQMLTSPSYPNGQSSPKKIIAIIAAIVGFVFITFGVVIVWQRNNIIGLLLKKS